VDLSGWQLAATIIAATFALVIVVVFLTMREGRSRSFRIGVFIERQDIDRKDVPDIEDTMIDSSEWPTRH
jgi:hypothetical protein